MTTQFLFLKVILLGREVADGRIDLPDKYCHLVVPSPEVVQRAGGAPGLSRSPAWNASRSRWLSALPAAVHR